MKIPIFSGERIIALCTPTEAMRYAHVPNATLIRKRKTKQIVQINLSEVADDRRNVKSRHGNGQKYTFVEAVGGEHTCPICDGSGYECRKCGGTGTVMTDDHHLHSLKFIHPANRDLFQLAVTDCMVAA